MRRAKGTDFCRVCKRDLVTFEDQPIYSEAEKEKGFRYRCRTMVKSENNRYFIHNGWRGLLKLINLKQTSDSFSDEELVLLVSAGDKHAFRVLARRHGGRFRALAYRFTADMALAEDLVQEAFVKLWTSADRFDDTRAKFTTWFHRIVINKCLDQKRKRTFAALPEGYDAEDRSPIADGVLENAAVTKRLEAVLGSLSARQYTAVTLSYFEGLTNQEAADVMELNIKAYESLLLRSRATMRKKLAADKNDLLSAFA